MFESIRRLFAHWHRIPKHNIPRWVRGKLYKQKYARKGNREYKKVTPKKEAVFDENHGVWFVPEYLKRVKYYYRNLK